MENLILGGLWFGDTKPNMAAFLKPIFCDLKKMKMVGVEVKSPLQPNTFMSK